MRWARHRLQARCRVPDVEAYEVARQVALLLAVDRKTGAAAAYVGVLPIEALARRTSSVVVVALASADDALSSRSQGWGLSPPPAAAVAGPPGAPFDVTWEVISPMCRLIDPAPCRSAAAAAVVRCGSAAQSAARTARSVPRELAGAGPPPDTTRLLRSWTSPVLAGAVWPRRGRSGTPKP